MTRYEIALGKPVPKEDPKAELDIKFQELKPLKRGRIINEVNNYPETPSEHDNQLQNLWDAPPDVSGHFQ
jgi:hypothetical protein